MCQAILEPGVDMGLYFVGFFVCLCFFKSNFFFSFLSALGHCCYMWAFSSCSEQELLPSCVHELLLLQSTGVRASVVVVHRTSCLEPCGIFPDQGSNLCPLHWQADSQPLDHQGSP